MALPLPLDDWRARAACRGVDPEIFFPVAETGPVLARQEAHALSYCARCPVVAECLTFALAKIPYGIAGGMTALQRAELKRQHTASRRTPPPVRSPLVSGPGARQRGRHTRARGIEWLVEGRLSRREIARRLDVDTRTVERWAVRPEVAPLLPERTASPSNGITRRQARAMGARRVS
jgi:hypothetical protein